MENSYPNFFNKIIKHLSHFLLDCDKNNTSSRRHHLKNFKSFVKMTNRYNPNLSIYSESIFLNNYEILKNYAQLSYISVKIVLNELFVNGYSYENIDDWYNDIYVNNNFKNCKIKLFKQIDDEYVYICMIVDRCKDGEYFFHNHLPIEAKFYDSNARYKGKNLFHLYLETRCYAETLKMKIQQLENMLPSYNV